MGILLLSFSLLSHGFSLVGLIESIPGISTLILAELSKKFRFLGVSFFAMVILLFYFAFRTGIKPIMLITFVILSAPLIGLGLVSLRKEL